MKELKPFAKENKKLFAKWRDNLTPCFCKMCDASECVLLKLAVPAVVAFVVAVIVTLIMH